MTWRLRASTEADPSPATPFRSHIARSGYGMGGFLFCRVAKRSQKPTKAEKTVRVDTVYGMLCEGIARANIILNCAEMWGVGERTADNYISEARIRLEQDCRMTREAFMAEALAGYREIRSRAEARGQLMVAKTALDAMVDLVGLKA